MNLIITTKDDKPFDGRGHSNADIIDRDSGKNVGYLQSDGVGFGNSGGILVSMFGGKYHGRLHRYEECVGFMKGVEAVLKHTLHHIISTEYPPARDSAA